jgi:hypothetical protein
MNLTKALTTPYSASKTPTVNNPAKTVKRKNCLCTTFNQLVTSSADKTYYCRQTGFNFSLSNALTLQCHLPQIHQQNSQTDRNSKIREKRKVKNGAY